MNLTFSLRTLPVFNRWCLHSYYSLCPYAPDHSGRILLAGADLDCNEGEVMILSSSGEILDHFGRHPVTPSFWHTGFWQSWSEDCRYVYYQDGTLTKPLIVRRELATGKEIRIPGDMEGIPASGEPGLSCSHSLLYAAGYGDGLYKPAEASIPFQARHLHGISSVTFDPASEKLIRSTADILEQHPDREKILEMDREIKRRLGKEEGLTLMTYCVRWNRQGTRFLFYFGNHCVVKERGEPHLSYVFTSDRNFEQIHLALDLCKKGVHWSWQPDGESLIGYGPDPENPERSCLAEIRYDGSGYRKLSNHASGGHPSVSPVNPDLIVTDERTATGGAVLLISRATGNVFKRLELSKFIGDREPPEETGCGFVTILCLTTVEIVCSSIPCPAEKLS